MTIDFPESHPQLGTPAKNYPYRDRSSKPTAMIYRFDIKGRKEIRPYCGIKQEWAFPDRRQLYDLDMLFQRPDEQVLITEGEKCADALQRYGFLATTSMGGSNGANLTDWTPLEGRKVIIWPDYDEAGKQYAEQVASLLHNIGATVSILPIHRADILRNVEDKVLHICNDTTLPKGWDAADALTEGLTERDIQEILARAERYQPNETLPAPHSIAANDNWPEPDKSILETEPAPPILPLDIFPAPIAEWLMRTAECKSAPVDYVAATVMTGSASLIGSSRRISPWEGWAEMPVLWSAVVGSPSSGKSPAMDPVLSIMRDLEKVYAQKHSESLREYEAVKLEAELASTKWEAEVKDAVAKGFAPPLKPERADIPDIPQPKRLIVRDATTEALAQALQTQPKGILTYRDELAGWFTSFDRYSGGKGSDRAFWLEAFGARPYTVDRIKNGGEPILIPYLASSILGGIQPDRLESCLMRGDDDGLSSRFLYFYPAPVKRQRPRFTPDNDFIEHVLQRLTQLEYDDFGGKQTPHTVCLSQEAADIFEAWWVSLPDREPQGRLVGWYGKLQGNVLRIALILHYLGWACSESETEPLYVEARHIQASIKFAEQYLVPMAERAHGLASHTVARQHTLTLADYIQKQGLKEFTVRELHRSGPMRALRADDIRAAVNDLAGYGWLRAAPVRSGETPGKAQARYIINPAL